ncbi:MAG: flagellar biosynthetic protein FliO [Steroidobacteraceae bacterium]
MSVGKFADPATVTALPTSGISSMGQVTVALVIVLAVLFAAAWAMRQFKLFNRSGQGALEVVQGINLGPKERAVLIKVQNRRLLLGVAPGCVNLLLELPADSVNEGGETPPGAPIDITNKPDFKALLKRSMGLS